jgi:outer membrane receptor for ferric coprogen and ferric-rhodotorulic acid
MDDPDVPDYEQHKIDNKISPRAGLTWLFSDDVSVYALYDQSYWIQFAKSYDGKPFLPLTGYNLETGMKGYFFNKKLSLNLSAYHIVKNNTITEDPSHSGSNTNRPVTSNGFDFI